MSFEQDLQKKVNEKMAGAGTWLQNQLGAQGTLSPLTYGGGGAAAGAMLGKPFGSIGMGLGALLGGAGGYGVANAINQQSQGQDSLDSMLLQNQMGLAQGGSQMDQQQNQLLQGIVDYLSSGEAPMGGEEQMDPSMMQGQGQMPQQKMSSANINAMAEKIAKALIASEQ